MALTSRESFYPFHRDEKDLLASVLMEPPTPGTIEIPLKSGDEVIELDTDQLPDGIEVLNIMKEEKPPLETWINVGLAYYRKKLTSDFERIFEEAYRSASDLQPYNEADIVRVLDMLGHYYGRMAYKEKNREKKTALIANATRLFTSADRIDMYDQQHLLGRAFFFIYEGENWSQADSQLNFVLNQGSASVPTYLGKACIAFNKKEYRNALGFYRKALRLKPDCPANLRLGMGHCFFRLGQMDKARLSFSRALTLDPECVGALVGLAVLDLNEKTQESIKLGVQKLSRAYNINQANPSVLNHLADHFFYKKEYTKVQRLALHAFYCTDNETMKAESCYQIARAYHVQDNYDHAFQYYYLSTQLASPAFTLPYYGLGQMYLHRNDLENAAVSFEHVLKAHPNNYETLKILGSLYAQSTKPDKREQAQNLFKKVTDLQPQDVEAWIEYAQLMESEPSKSLTAYLKAVSILDEINLDVAPEILNNIATLYYIKGEYDQSEVYLDRAASRVEEEQRHSAAATPRPQGDADDDHGYFQGIAVTLQYNRGRLLEAQGRRSSAESVFTSLVSRHPSYIDCYIRLACICRDRGHLWSASKWLRDALDVDQNHPDVWTQLALLHLGKHEAELALKKLERIVRLPQLRADAFARISLGNIWLNTLHHPIRDKGKRKRHQDRALSFYKAVLGADPRNIWAAHGIGCVLAHKGLFNEARDVFAQVREATADFADVWINIAHIYVEQKQHTAAIRMYENCIRKFSRQNDTDLLQYLARAFFKAGQLKECKIVLVKARHVKPWDPLIMFNLALVQKRLAVSVLQDETSSFQAVCEAIADLNMARCTFDFLSKSTDVLNQSMATDEARTCQDLLSQAKYHLDRAKSREEQERVVRKRREEERDAQRKRQHELQQQAEQIRIERERRLEQERGRFLEKAKQMILEPTADENRSKARKSTGGRSRRGDEFINDSDSSDEGPVANANNTTGLGLDSTTNKGSDHSARKRHKKHHKSRVKESQRDYDGLSAKQRSKIVSKEIVSDSSSSSSGSESDAEKPSGARTVLSSLDDSDEDNGKQSINKPPDSPPIFSPSDLSDDEDEQPIAPKKAKKSLNLTRQRLVKSRKRQQSPAATVDSSSESDVTASPNQSPDGGDDGGDGKRVDSGSVKRRRMIIESSDDEEEDGSHPVIAGVNRRHADLGDADLSSDLSD